MKLTSTISLKALKAKAHNAAVVDTAKTRTAIVGGKAQTHNTDAVGTTEATQTLSTNKANIRKRKSRPEIEREIASIYQALKTRLSDTDIITIEYPKDKTNCRAIISLYHKADFLRQKEEEEAQRTDPSSLNDRKTAKKLHKATRYLMFAFYPSTYNVQKLGSVAIYGDNALAMQTRILTQGNLFGHSVKDATIEIGRRPFVDVTFAA